MSDDLIARLESQIAAMKAGVSGWAHHSLALHEDCLAALRERVAPVEADVDLAVLARETTTLAWAEAVHPDHGWHSRRACEAIILDALRRVAALRDRVAPDRPKE